MVLIITCIERTYSSYIIDIIVTECMTWAYKKGESLHRHVTQSHSYAVLNEICLKPRKSQEIG